MIRRFIIKSVLLTLLLGFLFYNNTQAQLNYGLRGGMQYAWRGDETDGKWLLHGGIQATYKFNPVFSVEGDLLYSETAHEINYGYTSSTSVEYTFRYITLPLLAHFKASDHLSVVVGPECGFLLSAHYRNAVEYARIESKYTQWFDLGVSVGLNYRITPNFQLMARYVHGLRDIWSGGDTWTDGYGNRMIQLSVGYTLHRDTARSVFAKPERGIRWFAGLSQGISTSKIDDAYGNDKELTHYAAGVDVRLEFARYLYAASGIGYMQRGGTLAGLNQETIRLNYLTFPLIIGYSPVKTKPLTLSIEGGLAFEALVSSQNYQADRDYWDLVDEGKSMTSWIYGFEASTDAVDRVSIFLNYRFIKPWREFLYLSRTDEYYQTYEHILSSSGKILSVGARVKL